MAGGDRAGADRRGSDRRRPLRASPAAVRALRSAAHHRGQRLVPHDADDRRRRDRLQLRAARAVGVRAVADVLPARVPDRPSRKPFRPGAGRGRRAHRAVPLPPDGAARRAVSGAGPGGRMRCRMSRERVHDQRIGAGVHRRRRASAAGGPHHRAVRGGLCAARDEIESSEPAQAPRARARAGRGVLPLRRVQLHPRGPPDRAGRAARRRVGVAAHARGAADRRRVPRRPVALVGVHRAFDATACGEASRSPDSRSSAAAPSRKRSTTRRWKSCTGWATARATRAMQTATRSIRRRPRTAAP